MQSVFVELREFSEDVLLLFLRETCATVSHRHAEHAHRMAAELNKDDSYRAAIVVAVVVSMERTLSLIVEEWSGPGSSQEMARVT